MFASAGAFTSGDDCRGRGRGSRRLRMTEGRWAVLALLVMVRVATFAAGVAADSGHAQQTPRMHFVDRCWDHSLVRRWLASSVAYIHVSFSARSAPEVGAITQCQLELVPMRKSSESADVSNERAT